MTTWRDKALCRSDPSLWDGKATAPEAVHICRSHCPVLNACKAWAVGARLTDVTAGGISWNADGTRRQMERRSFLFHNVYCQSLKEED